MNRRLLEPEFSTSLDPELKKYLDFKVLEIAIGLDRCVYQKFKMHDSL